MPIVSPEPEITVVEEAPTAPETPAAKLKRLRDEKQKRDDAAAEEEEALELEALELDSKLSAGGAKRGKDYEIEVTPFGVFGIKLLDAPGIAALNKVTADPQQTDADKLTMVLRPYILPETKQIDFHTVCTSRPDVSYLLALAARKLLGSKGIEAKKKF